MNAETSLLNEQVEDASGRHSFYLQCPQCPVQENLVVYLDKDAVDLNQSRKNNFTSSVMSTYLTLHTVTGKTCLHLVSMLMLVLLWFVSYINVMLSLCNDDRCDRGGVNGNMRDGCDSVVMSRQVSSILSNAVWFCVLIK